MSIKSVEQARQYAPLAVAYVLGVVTFWGASAMFAAPGNEIAATTGKMVVAANLEDYDDSELPLMIEAGAEPRPEELREAAKAGKALSVRRLINLNADVNATDEHGRTPLFLAASGGKKDVVAALIDAGADTDAQTVEGQTPLMAAAIKGHPETIQLLILHDANVRSKTSEGATAHDLAIQNKHDSVARLIADEIDRQNRERRMVQRTQFLLAKLGYRPGGIDGYLGPRTRHAIIRFQQERGLNRDGRVTQGLIVSLDQRQKIASTEEKKPPKRRVRTARKRTASERAFRRASAVHKGEPAGKPSGEGWKSSTEKKKKSEGGLFGWLDRTFSDGDDTND